jgi:hypothetical protein
VAGISRAHSLVLGSSPRSSVEAARQSTHWHECNAKQENFDKPVLSQSFWTHLGDQAASAGKGCCTDLSGNRCEISATARSDFPAGLPVRSCRTAQRATRSSRWTNPAGSLPYFTRSLMSELQKLAKALDQIERRFPPGGKRYSTIVENPYEAGYMPFPKLTKRAAAVGRHLRAHRGSVAAK